MSCCKKVGNNIPQEQQRIVQAVKNTNNNPYINTMVKSNRSPAGTVARQCSNCGTKTIVSICPVCSTPLK